MFQLIVAVISIALVAALAIASIYYGGTAFNQGTLKANVVTLVNAGQQISGAQALYVTDFGVGAGAAEITKLTNGVYLQGAPATSKIAAGAWDLLSTRVAFVPLVQGTNINDICAEVVKQSGVVSGTSQFSCAAATLDANGNVQTGTAGLAFKL